MVAASASGRTRFILVILRSAISLTSQVNANTLAQAQAIIPDVRLPYANFRGAFSQMLRPFPQYAGLNSDFVNLASSNYNSLQITANKRMSSGLTFNTNYTWSKTISDALTLAQGRTAYSWESEKTHGESDRRHVFNAMVVYELPSAPESRSIRTTWLRGR